MEKCRLYPHGVGAPGSSSSWRPPPLREELLQIRRVNRYWQGRCLHSRHPLPRVLPRGAASLLFLASKTGSNDGVPLTTELAATECLNDCILPQRSVLAGVHQQSTPLTTEASPKTQRTSRASGRIPRVTQAHRPRSRMTPPGKGKDGWRCSPRPLPFLPRLLGEDAGRKSRRAG
ncbi:hypothetical protein MTO96_009126 [Rhipicephalus appendiculatus]